ncbi:related to ABC transporter [Sporisorium reilianum SRZ2]|uniref:Related to ABC transporter n=1 Tax=Sporisorium reilianum (strain SRZ2) TaxID=999809 RepID=E6ZXK7_SPORE|nr:related to ABC transporter [Sporisorium reilianum SRZ2]
MAHLTFCPNDDLFGPVSSCRAFDFTLRFQSCIFQLLPNAIFQTIAVGLIVFTLLSRRRAIQIATDRSACVQNRDGGSILLALLHLALMVTLLALAPSLLPGVTSCSFDTLVMPALALETFSALIISCALTFHRPDRPTPIVTLINTFLLFSSLFAAVQLRTFYFVSAARTSAFLPVLAADFGTRWLLFITTSTKPFDPRQTAEQRASFISTIFFFYLLPNLWKGTRQPIELNDIEPLAPSYASRVLEAKLFREWHASAGGAAESDASDGDSSYPADVKSVDMENISFSDLASLRTVSASQTTFLPKDPAAKPRLVHASVRAFAGVLFSPLPSKALYTVMTLLQPLLVQETLDFIASYSDDSGKPQPAAFGYGLIGAFALVYLLIALSSGHFTFSIYKTTCKLRGALVYAVYRKTLVLSVDALQDADTPSPTVMQSVDIERIVGGLDPFHEIWSAVVIIIVVLYLLWQQIGVAFVATIVTLAILFGSIPLMTKDASAHQKQWSQMTDERTGLISASIKAIKAIKQSALEDFLITKITSIRQREIKALVKYVQDLLFISLLGNVAGDILMLATITTFAIVFAYHHHATGAFPFTTSTVFTTITIVRIIDRPLFIIGRRYASVISAVTSLKRLETFLLLPQQVSGDHDAASTVKADAFSTAAAVFDGASMGWKQNDQLSTGDASSAATPRESHERAGPVLRDLNLVLPRNAVSVVVGEVGVGKTSFLCSLLGELAPLQGEVSLPVRAAPIAYVSQDPWTLGEKSIKENIVFYRALDEERYQRALTACGLVVDVQQLPKGDNTLAKHLSGGQKQRVALCRAVYSDAPTLVLDDVLSAVDASTAAGINQALFSRQNGLLRGKTIVMATNSVQQMQLADRIVQMGAGGTAKLLAGEAAIISKLADNIDTIRRRSAEERDSIDANGESSAAVEVRAAAAAAAAKEQKVLDNEEEQEDVMTGGINFSVFKHYFVAAGWATSLSYPVALALQTGFANGQLLWLQAWAKHVSEETLRGSIGLHIGILVLVVVARFFTYGGSLVVYLYLFCPKTSLQLHSDEVKGLLGAGSESFLNLNPGRMINRFTQDIYALDFQICAYYVNVVFFVIEMGFSLVLTALPAPYLLGVIVAMAAMYFAIYKLYSLSSRQLRRLEMATKSGLHSQFKETSDLQGLLTIRALQMQPQFAVATSSLLDTSQRPYYSLWTVRVWLQTWLNLLAMVLNTALVLIAVSVRHSSNAGLVAVALIQAISLSSDLNGLMSSWTDLEIGIVSLERIEQVITTPKDPKDDTTKLQEMACAAGTSAGMRPAAVGVRFEDVTVGYNGTEGAMSLRKVSFSLEPGERLGICGRSGSGKSTLLLSLLRILEPASGKILIDGVDTSTLTGGSVRRNISYIPQEPMILSSLTVRENLDPESEHADDEAYWAVLRQTSMFETISQLPEGLDHVLDLQSLSMGQKQLLNVARALLKARGLLVMDEATSNLDLGTDAQIQLALAAAASSGGDVSRADSKKAVRANGGSVPGKTDDADDRAQTVDDYGL